MSPRHNCWPAPGKRGTQLKHHCRSERMLALTFCSSPKQTIFMADFFFSLGSIFHGPYMRLTNCQRQECNSGKREGRAQKRTTCVNPVVQHSIACSLHRGIFVMMQAVRKHTCHLHSVSNLRRCRSHSQLSNRQLNAPSSNIAKKDIFLEKRRALYGTRRKYTERRALSASKHNSTTVDERAEE